MEVESDKDKGEGDKVEREPKSPEPESAISRQLELPEQGQIEQAEQEQVEQLTREQKPSGGNKVAESSRAEIFEGFAKINESLFSLEGVKKAVAWYVETGEKLANQTLELQEKATGWAKDTPFAPLFEAQTSFARKFVERSANAARTLWQIQPAQ